MSTPNKKKSTVIISGLNVNDSNRGTAALSYGAISFLHDTEGLNPGMELINFRTYNNPLKSYNRKKIHLTEEIHVNGETYHHTIYNVSNLELKLFNKFGITLPFSRFGKLLRSVGYVAAINGGDGFSDIYNTDTFLFRLYESQMAIKAGLPLIILPQTIGPFEHESNLAIAEHILRNATKVYARDNRFADKLKEMGIDWTLTNDLSYFMKPQPFDIDIAEKAIGINVSGLTYSNQFRTLSGQFDNYPYLIDQIIRRLRKELPDYTIYLISHSYRYGNPEPANDDIQYAREAYDRLPDKTGVVLIDRDLNSPQTKYVISRMKFFIGTRMHANFAAIFTKVPVFGLAYSYKFQGAFENNGIYGHTAMINDISTSQADTIVDQIIDCCRKDLSKA